MSLPDEEQPRQGYRHYQECETADNSKEPDARRSAHLPRPSSRPVATLRTSDGPRHLNCWAVVQWKVQLYG